MPTQVPSGSEMAVKVKAGTRRRGKSKIQGPKRLSYAKGGPVPSPAEGARAAAGGKDIHGRDPEDVTYGDPRPDGVIHQQNVIDHIVTRAQHAVEAKRKGGGKFPARSEFHQGDIDAYNRYGLGDAEKDYAAGGMVRKKYGDGGMVDKYGQQKRFTPIHPREEELLEYRGEKKPMLHRIEKRMETRPYKDEAEKNRYLAPPKSTGRRG